MEKLKVVIADDHPIVLLGVRELMERDDRFEIVGAHSAGN
jgi:two-component system capsular synthesis response regulator RcsB